MNTTVVKVANMSTTELEALPVNEISALSGQTSLAVLPKSNSDKAIAIPANTKIMLVLQGKIKGGR